MEEKTIKALKRITGAVEKRGDCCDFLFNKCYSFLPPRSSQRIAFVAESPYDCVEANTLARRITSGFRSFFEPERRMISPPLPINSFLTFLFGRPQGTSRKKDLLELVYFTYAFKCPVKFPDGRMNFPGTKDRKRKMARNCKQLIRKELGALCKDREIKLIVIATSVIAYQFSKESFLRFLYRQKEFLSAKGSLLPSISTYFEEFEDCDKPVVLFPKPTSRNLEFNFMRTFKEKEETAFEEAVLRVHNIVKKCLP